MAVYKLKILIMMTAYLRSEPKLRLPIWHKNSAHLEREPSGIIISFWLTENTIHFV